MTIPSVAFLGGSIGGWELLVVAVVVLILFGPKGLPEIARTIGKFTAQLRGAADDFRDQITRAAEEQPKPPASPPTVTDNTVAVADGGAAGTGTEGAATPTDSPSADGRAGAPGGGGDLHERAG